MGEIRIGTSGYSYRDWVGPVYPPGSDPSEFLSLYADRFDFTELNFTYYRLPAPGQLESIADRVSEKFAFVTKANGELTHERSDRWRQAADEQIARHAELGKRNAGMLLQFPFSFHYAAENRRYLASLADALPRPLFVEFRNDEWNRKQVFAEMERRGLALVLTDMPRLKGLPRLAPRATADQAYLRLHGRNRESWWSGTNITRYDYLYSTVELEQLVDPIRGLAAQSEVIYVAFNNHFAGQAVTNAEQLAAMLAD